MQLVAAQQVVYGQAAGAGLGNVLLPASRAAFELQPSQLCTLSEHKARVEASLRALQSVVKKLEQHAQLGHASMRQHQHSMGSQQQQGSQARAGSAGIATPPADQEAPAAAVLQDVPAAVRARTKDQQQLQGQAGRDAQLPTKAVTDVLKLQAPNASASSMNAPYAMNRDRAGEQQQQRQQISSNAAVSVATNGVQLMAIAKQALCFTAAQDDQQQHEQPHCPAAAQIQQQQKQQQYQQDRGTGGAPVEHEHNQQPRRLSATTPQQQQGGHRQQQPLGQLQSAPQQQQPQQQQLQEPKQHQQQLQQPRQQQQAMAPQQQRTQQVQKQQQQQQAGHVVAAADQLDVRWRNESTMWEGIDSVRRPLLQLHSRLGDQGSEQLLTVLGSPRALGAGSARIAAAASTAQEQAEARLQRAWKQLQITGGAAAPSSQQQRPRTQQSHQQQRPKPGLQVCQLASQQMLVRSQRLQQQLRQHQQDAVAASLSARSEGPGVRVKRAAAAAAERAWQPAAAAAAEEAEEQAHVACGDALEGGRCAAACDAGRSRSSRKPPVPRARKPWQPRMTHDDQYWKQARFMSVLEQPIECPAGQHPKHSRPEHNTARFAVLTVLHGAGWPNHVFWQRWVEAHPPGDVALMVHMKAGVDVGPGMVGHTAINHHKLKTSVKANWGDISLVEATIDSIAEILTRCPQVTHIGLASGHDIPVNLMTPGVLLPGVSSFGMYQFGSEEHRTLQDSCYEELEYNTELTKAEAQQWSQALTFHHQWMVLSREHAAAVVKLRTEITVIGRVMHKACNSVKADMAPDEFIIVTALRTHGYIRSIQRVEMRDGMHFPPGTLLNCYPTMVIFPAESSPHPVLWTDPDEKVKCQLEDEATQQRQDSTLSLRRCLVICQEKAAIFFRKVEIRQTRCEQQAELLSMLEQMWAGRSLKKAAVSRTASGASGSRGSKRKRADSRGPQTHSGSKGPLSRVLCNSSPAPSPAVSTADTDSDSRDGLQDVQSPVKRPATAQAMAAAAAAVAAVITGGGVPAAGTAAGGLGTAAAAVHGPAVAPATIVNPAGGWVLAAVSAADALACPAFMATVKSRPVITAWN